MGIYLWNLKYRRGFKSTPELKREKVEYESFAASR
jgi:hypothetical protein